MMSLATGRHHSPVEACQRLHFGRPVRRSPQWSAVYDQQGVGRLSALLRPSTCDAQEQSGNHRGLHHDDAVECSENAIRVPSLFVKSPAELHRGERRWDYPSCRREGRLHLDSHRPPPFGWSCARTMRTLFRRGGAPASTAIRSGT